MELKDFIKMTAQSVIDAVGELIVDNINAGVFINPGSQSMPSGSDCIQFDNGLVPVTVIGFDVAVTEEKEKSAGGGAKVKIASFELGSDGKLAKIDTVVSRVSFQIRIALPAQKGPDLDARINI